MTSGLVASMLHTLVPCMLFCRSSAITLMTLFCVIVATALVLLYNVYAWRKNQ